MEKQVDSLIIGVYVEKSGIREQIDVKFVKGEKGEFYNLENNFIQKQKVIIRMTDNETCEVILKTPDYIVDSDEDIQTEFEKSYRDKLFSLNSMDEDAEDAEDAEMDEKSRLELKPYDPEKIRVEQKPFSVEIVVKKIKNGEIDLNPDFQRKFVWTDITRKSRLIESILLRIPLPMFYLSEDEEGIYHVLDGLQRLTVLKSYLNNEFRLKNLEYLGSECDGKFFREKKEDGEEVEGVQKKPEKYVPNKYYRRIKDTMLNFNVVDSSTPDQAKYDIFRRINTGGKPLNRQEMRNAMATDDTRRLLKALSNEEYFKKASGNSVKDTRFADQELALRFIGFYLIDQKYIGAVPYKGNMASFLDEVMGVLNQNYSTKDEFIQKIQEDFKKAMLNAYDLFGEKAFKRTSIFNKALFLSVSRNSYKLNVIEFQTSDHNHVEKFIKLRNQFFNDKNNDFWESKLANFKELSDKIDDSLSKGTNEIKKIDDSYSIIKEMLRIMIDDADYIVKN